jgi:hypothetical protein
VVCCMLELLGKDSDQIVAWKKSLIQ